ncbi:olfactory receptor 8H1-like [Orycteropus afer afer]|uniref:Olfactory receptor 8H1-like n=1 Tax=Orycteropus afer afer TaxID=1230840 RepID=A0A8B7BB25_ORYAF|nr:olfactory receptor 8H1-like [Orycteropus afer afer]
MHTMGRKNNTNVSDFFLLGLTDSEVIRLVLFSLFLLIYLITVLGNAGMMLVIQLDLQLHTPMYFFLSHLSFLDLSYSTVITPKTLENLLTSNKYISFGGCFTQMFFFLLLIVSECFLLCSMAYGRYLAICNPLQYPVVMSRTLCHSLIMASYLIGFFDATLSVLSMNTLHFCDSNVVHHFFCDTTPVLVLSCTDTHDIETMLSILAGFNVMASVSTISLSYGSILFNILKINSSSGKRKAFSTCASHLLGVSIFFGSISFSYLKPSKSYSLGKDQVASVFYTIVIPMLNPLIYSLRNKEVKNAVIRVMQRRESTKHLR